ncbi:NAD(P)H oxidoreductase [Virgibacillus senegalensis]|uniref:NAD(P)H oxidoreductase n=1 Tax=Virgibacillus senegalensis TaxID=1499679 RepID=UPI00069EB657|nr:NAD(P)H oxidoreductase [Virgibacillus senegalensis]
MKVLTFITHPRKNSLTFAAAEKFMEGLQDAGHEADTVDLYRSGFSPLVEEADEPDWNDSHQHFSPETLAEMERLKQFDGLAFVFPLWWWSMPALMKGYIDRVWNYGFAYGGNKLPHEHVLWLALAGAPPERFSKRKYDFMMRHYFNIGLADYCGIGHSHFALFHQTINPSPDHVEMLLEEAYKLGKQYTSLSDKKEIGL